MLYCYSMLYFCYTQCYTSVILGVIHLLLHTPVYSVPIHNVILKHITCVKRVDSKRYTVLYNNAFYTVY